MKTVFDMFINAPTVNSNLFYFDTLWDYIILLIVALQKY